MIRKFIVLLFLSCIQVVSFSQTSIGIEGGVSTGYLNTNLGNRAAVKVDYDAGYSFSIPIEYSLSKYFSLSTAPGITQKNYFIDRTDSLSGLYEEFRNAYLQIPVLIQYSYGKRLQVSVGAGFYWGYWLSGRTAGRVPNIFAVTSQDQLQNVNYNEKYKFNSQTDNRNEFGWIVSLQAKYHLNTRYMLIASCRDYQSLTDQHKQYMVNQVPQYNQAFTFTAGLCYYLNNKTK